MFFAAGVSGRSIPVDAPVQDVTTSITIRNSSVDRYQEAPERRTGITPEALVAGAHVAPLPEPVLFDPATMMAASDVRPGMKGYGLTVFSGLRPERFEAEIVGVRHRMMAGTDIILCRLSSPRLEDIGVVAGMSGSPVYMDGKLIGAVAYGFLDVDDPLAGVTPIAEMLKVYNSTPTVQQDRPSDEVAGGSFGQQLFADYMALRSDPAVENLSRVAVNMAPIRGLTLRADDFGAGVADRFGLPESFTLEPLSAPVVLSGHSAESGQVAQTVFPGMSVLSAQSSARPVATGPQASQTVPVDVISTAPTVASTAHTTGSNPSAGAFNSPGGPLTDLAAFARELSGGYALSVPLIEGDLNMAVVGTVSWRHGERLVAFGHPMTQAGSVYLPMAAARINDIVRSRTRPFKLGEPLGHIGMLRQDRVPAVGGLFGQTARMFSLKTYIDDPAYLGQREFEYRIWNDRQMSPGLLLTALGETVSTAARSDGESAALFGYTIQLDDGTSITVEDYRSDAYGTIGAVISVMADAGTLLNNPFKNVALQDVEFQIKVTDRLREANLESITMNKAVYAPGETANLEWVVRPFRQEPVRLSWQFAVPADLPDGTYTIAVMDASRREGLEHRRHPGGQKMNDFDDVVRVLSRNFAQNRIYIALVDEDTGVAVSGKEMPRLPGSVINLMQETVESEYFSPVRGNFVVDADIATSYEISGDLKTTFKIERR